MRRQSMPGMLCGGFVPFDRKSLFILSLATFRSDGRLYVSTVDLCVACISTQALECLSSAEY